MTAFDFVTVGCFLVMAGAFFALTNKEPRKLLQLVLAAAAFAIADQLGNADYVLLASLLILAGVGYSVVVIRQD